MTREQAYDLASEFFGLALPHYIADWVVPAIMEAVAIEREACANIVADAAPGFCGGRAETVLYSVAETIRARGNE